MFCVCVFEGFMRTSVVASCSNMHHHLHFLPFSKCLVNQFSLFILRILSTAMVSSADKRSESVHYEDVKNISSSVMTIFSLELVIK